VGRSLLLAVDRPSRAAAEQDARAMCERLLANPVTEDFTVAVRETP
jgi:phosphoribosylformylglycinamidine (FGAM) synthase PurS component